MCSLRLGTLEKADRILALYENAESYSFSEIVEKSGLQRGVVQRVVFTLEDLGLLKRHQRSKRYSLSARFLSYAIAYLQAEPLTMRAVRYLESLTRQTTEAVGIDILDRIFIYHISQVASLVTNDFSLLPSRAYAVNTAAGRAIMSALPDEQVRNILKDTPLKKLTSRTLTDVEQILKRIEQARRDGVAHQIGETTEGEICVSAPIVGEGGYAVAAVTISISEERYSYEEAVSHFSDLVKTAAQSISSSTISGGHVIAPIAGATKRDSSATS
jgi:IclR family pca regulon transcriptional regulator